FLPLPLSLSCTRATWQLCCPASVQSFFVCFNLTFKSSLSWSQSLIYPFVLFFCLLQHWKAHTQTHTQTHTHIHTHTHTHTLTNTHTHTHTHTLTNTHTQHSFVVDSLCVNTCARSEERRVGKECRSLCAT